MEDIKEYFTGDPLTPSKETIEKYFGNYFRCSTSVNIRTLYNKNRSRSVELSFTNRHEIHMSISSSSSLKKKVRGRVIHSFDELESFRQNIIDFLNYGINKVPRLKEWQSS